MTVWVCVCSIPQMSAPALPLMSAPAPPARKKYTLAEVFGDDDDDEDEGNSEDVASTDYGRPPMPGK